MSAPTGAEWMLNRTVHVCTVRTGLEDSDDGKVETVGSVGLTLRRSEDLKFIPWSQVVEVWS